METTNEKSIESGAIENARVERLSVLDWGLIDYSSALQRQMDLVDLVHQELARETLVFCSHLPIVTTGIATSVGETGGWSGPVIAVERGGGAIYLGPSQIVCYPILDLTSRGRDLKRYVSELEAAVVRTLADFGIQATVHAPQMDGIEKAASEIHVGSRAIASIGVGVRKWVSFHGLALNLERADDAFRAETLISMEDVLGAKPDREAVQERLRSHLA